MSTSLDPGVRVGGRTVNAAGGGKAFLVATGNNPCTSTRFEARLVDTRLYGSTEVKTFLFATECRHQAAPRPVTWVPITGYPAPGAPSVIRLLLGAADPCFPNGCYDLDLTWDGSKWSGGTLTLVGGSITVDVTPVVTGGVVTSLHVNFSGACLTSFLNCPITCYYPLTAGGSAPLAAIASACCGGVTEPAFTPTVDILGYTQPRVKARFSHYHDGTPVYVYGEACPKVTCREEVPCCGCDASPLAWRFTVAGVTNGTLVGCPGTCVGFNGTWTLLYGANPCGSCCWAVPSSESTGACTSGTPWQLTCDGANWVLATQTGGGAQYTLAVASWKCFGPNTMALTTSGTSCLTFPATVTLSAA